MTPFGASKNTSTLATSKVKPFGAPEESEDEDEDGSEEGEAGAEGRGDEREEESDKSQKLERE